MRIYSIENRYAGEDYDSIKVNVVNMHCNKRKLTE